MFLGLHALLFDTRVFRHLVHNIHLRSDSLAAASWKALARIHLLVILPSAAYLHAVSPFPALQPLLAAFEARPPFPEYHGLLLPLACEAVAQLAGYAFLCAVVFLLAQHSACTRTTTSKKSISTIHHKQQQQQQRRRPWSRSQQALLMFQLSQLWLPGLAAACLFAHNMQHRPLPPVVFKWAANILHVCLTGLLLHVRCLQPNSACTQTPRVSMLLTPMHAPLVDRYVAALMSWLGWALLSPAC